MDEHHLAAGDKAWQIDLSWDISGRQAGGGDGKRRDETVPTAPHKQNRRIDIKYRREKQYVFANIIEKYNHSEGRSSARAYARLAQTDISALSVWGAIPSTATLWWRMQGVHHPSGV